MRLGTGGTVRAGERGLQRWTGSSQNEGQMRRGMGPEIAMQSGR